jgi:hypothetical protein
MEKPFDLKDLEARLKARGLTEVEGLAEIVAEEVFDWTEQSALIHPNILVKSVVPAAIAVAKPLAKGWIDKIDGQEG